MNASSSRAWVARLPLVLALGLLSAAPAHAYISCNAWMSDLNFGPVNPLAPGATDVSATLSYQCSSSAVFTTFNARLCFSIGEPGGGSTNPRLMSSGTNQLQFQLYQDAGRSAVWGSQFFGAFQPVTTVVTLRPGESTPARAIPVYGRIWANQNTAVPGNYLSTYRSADTGLTINESSLLAPYIVPSSCSNTVATTFPFTVSAVVEKRCEVTAGAASDISLGTVPASASNIPGSGSISVACTHTTPYNVGLSPSNGNTAGAGVMKASGGSTDLVPYQLYQDASMTRIWGNTATPTSAGNGVSGTGTGSARALPVYVRAPSADYQPDSYSDTVTVVVNY